jgi:xyloglucan fucosyltransferase
LYKRELVRRYGRRSAADGRLVRFHTASEFGGQSDSDDEVRMALAEMWLLAFGHELLTSGYSTFGYVAQGLGALRPRILRIRKGDDDSSSDQEPALPPPCSFGQSVEPCTHYPARLACLTRDDLTAQHSNWIRMHVRHCQDQPDGWQLVVHDQQQSSLAPPPSLASFLGD